MARHSLGSIAALSSDISKWVFVTAISVAPMAVLTCSGLSSNTGSAVSARGGAVVVVVVDLVVDVLVPWLLPLLHPPVRMQMLATASAAVSRRTCSPPYPAVTTNRSARRSTPQRCRLKLGCDERIFARGG